MLRRAGGRPVECNVLVQDVVVGDDPRPSLARWAAGVPGLDVTPDELLAAPQLPAGSVEGIAEQVLLRREHYGFGYVTVFEHAMERFAPVLHTLRDC